MKKMENDIGTGIVALHRFWVWGLLGISEGLSKYTYNP